MTQSRAHTRQVRRALGAVVVAITFVGAACGGDDDGSAEPDSVASESAPLGDATEPLAAPDTSVATAGPTTTAPASTAPATTAPPVTSVTTLPGAATTVATTAPPAAAETEPAAPGATDAPAAAETEAPAAAETEGPAGTEAAVPATEQPAGTEAPVATEAPAATEPEGTEAPAGTEAAGTEVAGTEPDASVAPTTTGPPCVPPASSVPADTTAATEPPAGTDTADTAGGTEPEAIEPAESAFPIERCDIGPVVTLLQFTLQQQGYAEVATIDGDFGDQTLAGVTRFQEENDLPVTGIVDEATWEALSPQSCGVDRNDNGFIDPSEIDLGAEGCAAG